jgi:hypothetical protein
VETWVVTEVREHGNVGLFTHDGRLVPSRLRRLRNDAGSHHQHEIPWVIPWLQIPDRGPQGRQSRSHALAGRREDIADQADLHYNTVRFHLDALVEESLAARAGPRRCLRRGHRLRRAALYANFAASVDGVTALGPERPFSGMAVSGSCGAASRRPSVVTNGSQLPCGEERDNSCLGCPPLSAGMVCSMPRDAIPVLMCG